MYASSSNSMEAANDTSYAFSAYITIEDNASILDPNLAPFLRQ